MVTFVTDVIILTSDFGSSDWIKIKSKFSNKCKVCLDEITVGEMVLWKKGEGIKHESCKPVLLDDKPTMIITEKEWIDFKQYTRNELVFITNCQFCGTPVNNLGDTYTNAGKRVCEKHFTT